MNFIASIQKAALKNKLPEIKNKLTNGHRDYVAEIISIIKDGKISRTDLNKVVTASHIVQIMKKLKSVEEQNNYLQKYLKEMVNENEKLQSELSDAQMTLKQAKQSLAELTTEMQNMYEQQAQNEQIDEIEENMESGHLDQQQQYYEQKNDALREKISQIQMSMTKGEDIDIHRSLNGHSNPGPTKDEGYISGLSSTSKSNGSKNESYADLEQKIQTVRSKYADDRDKVKDQVATDGQEWLDEAKATELQIKVSHLLEEIKQMQKVIDKYEETRVDNVFPAMQEILDKIDSLNTEDKEFSEPPLCLGFYDQNGKLWHIQECKEEEIQEKSEIIEKQTSREVYQSIQQPCRQLDSSELLKDMEQNRKTQFQAPNLKITEDESGFISVNESDAI